MIWFAANVLGRPLDPWQQWLVIHLGEMLPDGRPRFRKVVVVVARQNGKTHLCTVLALFWLYVERWPMVFGTSNKIEYAADAWKDAVEIALSTPALAAQTGRPRYTNGQNNLPTRFRSNYTIGAANADGGRSKRVDRAIGDELRQQKDWVAYAALVPAMNARPNAQIVWITNMGDLSAVVLNALRQEGLDAIAAGDRTRPTALFEWSAPEGSHPTDVHALAAANPQAGRRIDWDTLLEDAREVSRPGADQGKLATFLTEIMCMSVKVMDPAVGPAAWLACLDPGPIPAGRRPAACIDVSRDQGHVTLAVACTLPDHRVRVETVAGWATIAEARAALPALVAAIRPSVIGWFPSGPAASLNADLTDRRKKGVAAWPPPGVRVAEIKTETAAVCMGFSGLVDARQVAQSGQPLLDDHVGNAQRKWTGSTWVADRTDGGGRVDAFYAVAGAAHLARTAPSRGKVRVVRARGAVTPDQ